MRVSLTTLGRLSACMLCVWLAAPDAMAETAPVAESFELYSDGYLIANEDDWSGATPAAGKVSTDVGAISALTTYTNDGGVFPLPAETHTKVLAVTDSLTNTVSSATGGVVITEWLVMPTLRDAADSPGDDNYQTAFYVNTNSDVVIWRRDLDPTPTNAWLALTGSPDIDTGTWMRVTLILDYATDRYQLAIDGTAISDTEGEQRDGTASGTWFHMVQTNSAMARFRADAGAVTYIDDLVFTNRAVSYSGTVFTEATANNGSIATTQTITLVNDTFVGSLNASHVSVGVLPSGLSLSFVRIDATTAELTLSGNAAAPHTANATVAFTFLDTAFTIGSAASVVGSTNTLTLEFHDGLGLDWPTTTFSESTANNGTIGNEIALTLVGDTFSNATYNAGDEYTLTGSEPANLDLVVTYVDDTHVTLSLDGTASSHDGGSGGFTLAFNNAAFGGGSAAAVPNASQALTVTFLAQPVLTYSGTAFAEASNNNGMIGNTQTATLVGTTLTKSGTLTPTTDYTISGTVPGGLPLTITSDGVDELTISFDTAAPAHTASDGGSFGISFTDALFANVAVANITGSSETFSVTFDNQPTISYSGTVFSELAGGLIDNTDPIEITLSGDAFSGANGSDFVAGGKVTTDNVPAGLTLTLTKSSATTLLARLIGTATDNTDPGDDVNNLTIIFQNTAFTADAAQVAGYSRSNLVVDFNNSVLLINTVPYQESFESYASGYVMPMTKGWQSTGAGTVTQEPSIVSALNSDFSQFPIDTAHTKVLRVTDELTDEIKSSPGGQLYTDVMLYVTAKDAEPAGSADYQVAFYVNSSEKLVLWHDDGGGAWLETATTVTTGAWHRFTVKQDQTNLRFQLYLDGAIAPVSDAAGYADRTGEATSGSWFKMVDKSGFMSRIRVQGADDDVPAYMDDLVVVQETPEYLTGSLFMFR
jgi:hypothetical protein